MPIHYAIDYLETRPDVDARRVGLMGVSLGGYYALRAAAFEPRLRAIIGNCGGYNFESRFEQLPALTRGAFISRAHASSEAEAREKLAKFNLEGVYKE